MQAKTAVYYDRLYAALGKDYAAEAERVKEIVAERNRCDGNALLDVACGTAAHAVYLADDTYSE